MRKWWEILLFDFYVVLRSYWSSRPFLCALVTINNVKTLKFPVTKLTTKTISRQLFVCSTHLVLTSSHCPVVCLYKKRGRGHASLFYHRMTSMSVKVDRRWERSKWVLRYSLIVSVQGGWRSNCSWDWKLTACRSGQRTHAWSCSLGQWWVSEEWINLQRRI